MSRIFLTGDTHGDIDHVKLYRKNFIEGQKLTKNDYVIVLGDFGTVWYSNESNKNQKMIDFYNSKKWTTLFIDGNHENFDELYKYPIETWNGGKIHRISDSIIHLMRGQVFNIDNKKFFTMGGASSIDKESRSLGISWWPQELPSYAEYEEALDNLEKSNYNVDYVLTHCCSSHIQNKLLGNTSIIHDDLNKFFDNVENDLKFKHWYFGHYHMSKEIDNKHTCLYNEIVEL